MRYPIHIIAIVIVSIMNCTMYIMKSILLIYVVLNFYTHESDSVTLVINTFVKRSLLLDLNQVQVDKVIEKSRTFYS
ncbi:hypothetical protein KUTeg_001647 [Tegillarca granosa]|uniref:Uncharacterized protein n=1 Tax=Tegillarca granosa TaxID=220873 RepID=A0ABQ9FS47_TEGGR|nr:hypothetical protein KUTeg_001647 [Tegillarca granosa]